MFKETKPEDLNLNPFTSILNDTFLITAGTKEGGFNTMTAAWGGLGVFNSKPNAIIYVRQPRYTKEFVDREGLFTCTFFGGEYRKELTFCGRNSGRDVDKFKETGLTPWFTDGSTAVSEGKIVLVCKKMFETTMQNNMFADKSVPETLYKSNDNHQLYIADIIKSYIRE